MPADTRIPDASLWSHSTVTSALAGSLAGYYPKPENYPQKHKKFERSCPHIATFPFTPVQELIQHSRKMRDFWAGSWLLHYLSAKVCWRIAWKYGPDSLLYPCLYEQPLIDHWLQQKYDDFKTWTPSVEEQKLLTAGFPNVIVMVLPNNGEAEGGPVAAAMRFAEQALKEEWANLSQLTLADLQRRSPAWQAIDPNLWRNWLDAQWQTYWTALPLGDVQQPLHHSLYEQNDFEQWTTAQNKFAQLRNRPSNQLAASNQSELFLKLGEEPFLKAIFNLDQAEPELPDDPTEESEVEPALRFSKKPPNLNVGSWWGSLFDQLRRNLTGLKNARTWQMPTAFGPRSTISGLGPVVHPCYDPHKPGWATEGQTRDFWSNQAHLFDGVEELNPTEVVKRGLHQVLGDVLDLGNKSAKVPVVYPDLSSGVAGWLKQVGQSAEILEHYQASCRAILRQFSWAEEAGGTSWGIPWIAQHHRRLPNPRLLNAGWLIEDCPTEDRAESVGELKQTIARYFSPGNNPTDWYVLAVGDGDDMGGWLKGNRLKPYEAYIPDALVPKIEAMPTNLRKPFQDFLEVKKRMGPATHAALSRALLDFSNQLVPYLTEQRYAGRLIYGGGDDVLAYTNLWEWDSWLWDIQQCFKGESDPGEEFKTEGNYWQWHQENPPPGIAQRPLFTLGKDASISFGVVIAHNSVPLAIALESLQEAEKQAKAHRSADGQAKDAVQVRVIYGNGNTLSATAKFKVLHHWRQLVQFQVTHREVGFDPALFEHAAELLDRHPIPSAAAIEAWVRAFCGRRDIFKDTEAGRQAQVDFQAELTAFTRCLWRTTPESDQSPALKSWLKLAAFVLRKRNINISSGGQN